MHVRALDLFSGGGGSSSGARKAGCDIVAGVDAWATASATYAVNFPEAKAIHDRLEGDSVLPAVKALGRIDLLLASPECTSHTCARGSRPPSEESRLTAMQVINHVEHFKPRWVVIENVIQMRKWERYGELATYLASTYALHEQVLDAADFGVPQTRRRLFMLCDREQLVGAVRTTARVHRAARLIIDETGTWATRPLYSKGRAAATLERAERAFAAVGKREPFLLVYYGTDGGGGWQDLERPLRTITTLDRFALVEPGPHGHTIRMLQPPELRRAMGLPASHRLLGTRREQIKSTRPV